MPDLRGFGDSDLGPDGFHDVAAHALDLYALVHDVARARPGGAARRRPRRPRDPGPRAPPPGLGRPAWCCSTPRCRSTRSAWPACGHAPPREASDYFVRQGTDADALAAELATPEQRRRYIATFYTSRFWAHPGALPRPGRRRRARFGGSAVVDFHTEPFADAAKLRARSAATRARSAPPAGLEPPRLARNEHTPTLLLFGPSDHVIYPDFDRMAATVFPRHTGPVPAARLRSLRAVGGAARPGERHGRVLFGPARAGITRPPSRGCIECLASAHSGCLVRRDRGGAPSA